MLKPRLETKISNAWVDPREAKSDEDLLYKYKVAWAMAEAVSQIFAMLEEYEDIAKKLEAKERGEEDNKFKIGK